MSHSEWPGLMCVWQGEVVQRPRHIPCPGGVEVSRPSGRGRGTLVWSHLMGHSTWKLPELMLTLSVSPSFNLLPYLTFAGKSKAVFAIPVARWNHMERFKNSEA